MLGLSGAGLRVALGAGGQNPEGAPGVATGTDLYRERHSGLSRLGAGDGREVDFVERDQSAGEL